MTVSDADDNSVESDPIQVDLPQGKAFSISGHVADGPMGAQAGVKTGVRLRWNPLGSSMDTVLNIQSQAATGYFKFDKLLGAVEHFRVRVDGGTD